MIPDYKTIIGGIKMSKTIRRRHVPDSRVIGTHCYAYKVGFKDCLTRRCSKNCPHRDDDLTVSIFHRDTHEGHGLCGAAPKSFRKMINREKRSKDKAETTRINKQGDYDEYTFDKWRRDAGWMYW